jgi:RimJ/RimL family protein N-acetyltransferase
MSIDTTRLHLRSWREADREQFAALHADPEVMLDYGGPIGRAASDAKFDRYVAAFQRYGLCRWAIEHRSGEFLGYAGIMPGPEEHPIGLHYEIGWRLLRAVWGQGFATEAARAALEDGLTRVGLREVVAYTSAENLRSRSVMERLGMQRDPSRDFTATYDGLGNWRGLVWSVRAPRR